MHKEYKYCTLEQFNHCLCHPELGVLQQLKLLYKGWEWYTSQQCVMSLTDHDKEKEQCLLLV